MQTRHSFLVYNMADRSNRQHGDTLRHAAVWSSAKPTPHSTILRSHDLPCDLPCAASLAGIQPVRPRAQRTSP